MNTRSSPSHILIAAASLGMTSIAAQIILLREFVSVCYGNELVLGIVLCAWMVLTALGAFCGRFLEAVESRRLVLPVALTALGALPVATVFLLRFLRNRVFPAGSMIGLAHAGVSALVLLAPACLLSGMMFTFISMRASVRSGTREIGAVYSWESLGSAAGGVVFTLLLATLLETFQALSLLCFLNIAAAVTIGFRERVFGTAAAAGFLSAGLIVSIAASFLDRPTRALLFPGQEIIRFQDTPYGNVTLTRQGEQVSFFENNVLLFSTQDLIASEENVHYALVQRSTLRSVLLIGGGISGMMQEVLKYPVDRIDYIELSPWILQLAAEYAPAPPDGRIRVIAGDARLFLRSAAGGYDAVLVTLPDPGTAQLNRYYTLEFFRDLKRKMDAGGVVSLTLLPAADYLGSEARQISSVLLTTLRQVFSSVLIVPGERNYFLASDAPLDIHISSLISRRGIPTSYVNRYYLDDTLLARRSTALMGSLDTASTVNTDFHPIAYYRQMAYWVSLFAVDPGPWLVLAAVVLLVALRRSSPIALGMFAGGFVASSLEIILLLVCQVLLGSLYQMTGVVITAFMGGLAAGSCVVRRHFRHPSPGHFVLLQLAVAGVCFLLPAAVALLQSSSISIVFLQCVFAGGSFAIACLIGAEFAVAAAVQPGRAAAVASELYGLDLLGAAFGALLVSVYAVPLVGILRVSLFTGLVSAAGAMICQLSRHRFAARPS